MSTIKTITVNGHTVRVCVREGLTCTTPLLMFNGIGASLELVMPFIAALSPDLEVIAFDIPGVGGSPTPEHPYSFSDLTYLATHVLDHLKYDQVDVIGLSWGGFLAQQFAFDYPHRCRKLILAATSCGMASVPPSLKVLSLMSSPRRYTDPEYAASIAPEIYGGKFRHDKELSVKHASKMTSEHSGTKGYKYQMLAICWWTSVGWVHQIKQPTLILAGNDDPIIPLVNMQILSNRIPNSQLYVFDDGHLFLLTDLPKVVPIINAFLQES